MFEVVPMVYARVWQIHNDNGLQYKKLQCGCYAQEQAIGLKKIL